MRQILLRAAFLLFTAAQFHVEAAGFLHTQGVTNIDINGNPIQLRGVNLGSWLWPEYYMMGSPNLSAYANAGTGSGNINNYYDGLYAAISDLLNGDTNLMAQVLDAYWTNYVTAPDIAYLHSQGFNSVRVPFDFEEFFQVTNWANNYPSNGYDIDVGFKYLDNLVSWCSSNSIYVIPDSHCPPGGPNNESVVNCGGTANTNTASVFTSAPNLVLCGHIWSRIAAHFATNQWIGGYDLLNEPVNTIGNGQVGSPTLANTYSNLVKIIRAVDTNHMLLCEGDDYASTLYDVDNTGWTDTAGNLSFSDHDYGSTLPLGTGNRSTAVAANVPDWAGEFGINSTRWYNRIVNLTYSAPTTLTSGGHTATIQQGWCFWAYKSCQYYTVVQNPQTPGWMRFKAYWASGNSASLKPSTNDAFHWLIDYARAANFSNCVTHPEVVDALMRTNANSQSTGFTQLALPYKTNARIPGKIFAVDYDMGDSNVAYVDTVSEDQANHGPGGTSWNNGSVGRDDGVDTQLCSDPGTLLKVGWNDAGEWQRHTVSCFPGTFNIYIRYAGGATNGQIDLSLLNLSSAGTILGSNDLTGAITLPSTGSYTQYATYVVSNVVTTNSGTCSLQTTVVSPGYDLVYVEFASVNGPPLPPTGEVVAGAQATVAPGLTGGVSTVAGNGEVSLNWVSAGGATGYRVKRSNASGGPYTTVATVPSLSYLDAGLTNGVIYYYVISSVNGIGAGANSTEVNATPQATSLPTPFMDQDIGVANLWSGDAADVGWAGSAAYSGGTYTVSGSGIDIWNIVDSFHFAYRAISGDCTNIVRVSSLQNTDPWAKAGIMVRETLNPDSMNAFMTTSSQNGALFSTRGSTGVASTSSGQTGISVPYWLKLVRQGSNFTGFSSPDGSTWTQVGTASVSMATNIFVGLAVTAHNNVLSNTATFDSVTIAGQLPAPPTTLSASLLNAEANLAWISSPDALAYNVKRASSSNGVYSVVASNVVASNYLDSTVTPGAIYYYAISSVNVNGESANSVSSSVAISLPTLGVNMSVSNVSLSWPTNSPGFSLYTTTNLTSPANWTIVSTAPTNQGSNLNIELPIETNANRFFRLKFSN